MAALYIFFLQLPVVLARRGVATVGVGMSGGRGEELAGALCRGLADVSGYDLTVSRADSVLSPTSVPCLRHESRIP